MASTLQRMTCNGWNEGCCRTETGESTLIDDCGVDVASPALAAGDAQASPAVGSVSLTERIIAALRTVHDPEIPVNIYDLGLIYRIEPKDQGLVEIDMTLTAPGCPVAGEMLKWVENAVSGVKSVGSVNVNAFRSALGQVADVGRRSIGTGPDLTHHQLLEPRDEDIMIELTTGDGHKFSAYRADPEGAPKGAAVVVQDSFELNSDIRKITDEFAAKGYLAIAPSLFDSVKTDVALGYDEDGLAQGLELRSRSARSARSATFSRRSMPSRVPARLRSSDMAGVDTSPTSPPAASAASHHRRVLWRRKSSRTIAKSAKSLRYFTSARTIR